MMSAQDLVAPLAGAWIEIYIPTGEEELYKVAPLAGAWIEMLVDGDCVDVPAGSLPSRERGLKFQTCWKLLLI